MTIETALETYKDRLRENFTKYTIEAFHMLPKIDKPRILDIGCGSGIPTMELARLSDGQVTGLDIEQSALNRLKRRIKKAGLSDRVKILKCSMLEMDFANETFDIIWAEGSIRVIGFKRGLVEWRQFLKPNGFLVIHDTGNIRKKLKQVGNCGYELLEHFTLPEDAWWIECYAPLEKRIKELRAKCVDDAKSLAALDRNQQFIELFKKNPSRYGSAFFIMKKV